MTDFKEEFEMSGKYTSSNRFTVKEMKREDKYMNSVFKKIVKPLD